jgi:hypothetical protein
MRNLALVLALSFTLPGIQLGQEPPSLSSIRRIQVGSMGQSDEAERFRLLLEDELGKVGFATTTDAKTADAVLTGALSVRVYADTSRARVTVVLKTPDGLRIWAGDFEPHYKFGRVKDTVRLRAQDVAKALRKDVDKAAESGKRS